MGAGGVNRNQGDIMAKIHWGELEGGLVGFGQLPSEVDWADPTHAPLMAVEVLYELGNCECLSEEEEVSLWGVAIDAMPGGEAAVRLALEEQIRALAAAGDWSEWLFAPGTRRYPWEGFDPSED